jgi:hypothetical protein
VPAKPNIIGSFVRGMEEIYSAKCGVEIPKPGTSALIIVHP